MRLKPLAHDFAARVFRRGVKVTWYSSLLGLLSFLTTGRKLHETLRAPTGHKVSTTSSNNRVFRIFIGLWDRVSSTFDKNTLTSLFFFCFLFLLVFYLYSSFYRSKSTRFFVTFFSSFSIVRSLRNEDHIAIYLFIVSYGYSTKMIDPRVEKR